MKEELEKEKMLKEAENLFKMRCNPLTDPGYRPQQSDYTGNISEVGCYCYLLEETSKRARRQKCFSKLLQLACRFWLLDL